MKFLLHRDINMVFTGYNRKVMSDTLYEQIPFYGLVTILLLELGVIHIIF